MGEVLPNFTTILNNIAPEAKLNDSVVHASYFGNAGNYLQPEITKHH